MRGMTEQHYIQACRSLWSKTKTDKVYAIKIFAEPLVDTQFADQCSDISCILVARCDPDGRLVDAPLGYNRPEEENVFLSQIVVGSPMGVETKKETTAIRAYLLAYFDILGFKEKLRANPLKEVRKLYLELIEKAIRPQETLWSKNIALSSRGEIVPALMWTSIKSAYASDSIILHVSYNHQLVEEFFRRAALLFCSSLRCQVPLRGVIAFGEGVFDKKRNIFIGAPLVEASTLEQNLDCIGVALAKSMQQGIPIPPHFVQEISPPMTPQGKELFGGLVLDWPRVWRKTFTDSAVGYLSQMSPSEGPENILARYKYAANFFEFSDKNQNWCIPTGWEMIGPDDLS